MHGAGLGVFTRLPLGVGDVDRYDHADLAAAGMAGLPPAGVIAADVSLELADTRRPHREEDRQPHPPDRGVRLLGHRRDAKRRVRLLVGLGHRAHVVELEILALVREPILPPRLEDDLERFVEPRLALLERDVEAGVLAREPAAPHAEVEPSLAQVIERRHVLGQAQRMAQG